MLPLLLLQRWDQLEPSVAAVLQQRVTQACWQEQPNAAAVTQALYRAAAFPAQARMPVPAASIVSSWQQLAMSPVRCLTSSKAAAACLLVLAALGGALSSVKAGQRSLRLRERGQQQALERRVLPLQLGCGDRRALDAPSREAVPVKAGLRRRWCVSWASWAAAGCRASAWRWWALPAAELLALAVQPHPGGAQAAALPAAAVQGQPGAVTGPAQLAGQGVGAPQGGQQGTLGSRAASQLPAPGPGTRGCML